MLTDQKTIRDAGPDGTCPLCRQKLGSHFGSLDAEFTQKLQELTDKAAADREKQEKLGKEKTTVESLKPLLGQIRTFSEKLRQKPVYEAKLADLEAKRTRKIQDQAVITSSLAELAYNEEEYLACERETVTVQNVQLRFIALGKKIGEGIMVKKQLGELTSRITRRNTELTTLSKEIAEAAFSPDEVTERERAMLQPSQPCGMTKS